VNRPCYVYAIVGRDTPLPSIPAGKGAELSLVPWRELAAVTGRMVDDGSSITMKAVLHHEAVVEAVRQQGRALPVRFGTAFRDAASVASALAERYEPLTAELGRLGDKVELSLTALWAAPRCGQEPAYPTREDAVPAGQSPGAQYLHARAAELRRDEARRERAKRVAHELERDLGGLVLERRVSLCPSPRVVVRAAYLLDPARVGDFKTAFERIHGTRAELRVLLTGPWPPYSFVRRTHADDGAALDAHLPALVQTLTDAMRERFG
jgi:hypothetical protein